MRREISSSATPIYKAMVILFFGCTITILIFMIINAIKTSSEFFPMIFVPFLQLLAFCLFGILLIRSALSWKKVEIEDSGLTVTNINFFTKKTSTFVPFENIKCARQNFWQRGNSEVVIIEFNEPTFFGTKIKFVPTMRFFTFFAHPIVDEINLLVGKNKSFLIS